MPPTVSINLCCYNSEKYLRETLDSIIGQTYKDWELIIINDGSADSTESIINEYIKHGYPIVYHYQENRGLSYSRNEALKRSQGEYIAFIDHDDLWLPDKLEKQIPLFIKNQNVGLVYSDAICFNEIGRSKRALKKDNYLRGFCFDKLFANYSIILSTAIVRKIAIDELDEWFDTRFTMIEEADLFRRISYSWNLDFIPRPLASWRVHANSLTWSKDELFAYEGELMIKKYSQLYPEFDSKYVKEKKEYLSTIARKRSLSFWRDGNRRMARNQISPYLWDDKKNIVLFVFTLFPYKFYKYTYGVFRILPNENL